MPLSAGKFWFAAVVLFFCVPLFIGLDRTDLDNDEAIYSFAVETMLKDGDWLTPKAIPSETRPFLEKPPLKFWITAVPIRLGLLPANEFGFRFMDAVMGSLAFLYVFAVGRRLAGPVCGFVAVLLLFTHAALLHQHGLRSNNMEAATVLAYTAGVYHFMAWRSINPDVKRHVYAMSLWFVLAFMTKFVAALFLPVILATAALLRHEDRGRLYRDWKTFAAAALLALALILPWFVYQYVERGPSLYDTMFGEHVFKRFTSHLDPGHLHPWHYYLSELWNELGRAGTRLLVTVGAILLALQTLRRRWTEGAVIVLWFALPMIAISAGTSKLYHYAYPFLPPVALAGGWLIAVVARRVDGWLIRPVNHLVSRRDSFLPHPLRSHGIQSTLTYIGLAALTVAGVTAAFGRLHLTLASMVVRNSSVLRPLLIAAIAWLVAAPAVVWRGAIIGAAFLPFLPLATYRANVDRASQTDRAFQLVRACLKPVVANELARGKGAPGVWAEPDTVSHVPFYYLRDAGPWQQRNRLSDTVVVRYLLLPGRLRPVLLTPDHYREIMKGLVGDRPALLERTAEEAGVDPEVLKASLRAGPIGVLETPSMVLALPGPYASCGFATAQAARR